MHAKVGSVGILIGGLAIASSGGSALALPTYGSFAMQARDANDPIPAHNMGADCSLFGQGPDIDGPGHVACRLFKPVGESLWLGAGDGTGGVVAAGLPDYESTLDIKAGLVALSLAAGGLEVRDLAGTLVTSYPPGGPEDILRAAGVRLTSGDGVAYRSNNQGVHKLVIDRLAGANRVQTVLLRNDGAYNFLFTPATNSTGQMAVAANRADGGAEILRLAAGNPPEVLAGIGATYSGLADGIDINDGGQVAYFVELASTTQFQLMLFDGATSVRLAKPGDAGIVDGLGAEPPSINASGVVAFVARDVHGDALFVADTSGVSRVIGDGDTVQTDLGPLTLGFETQLFGRRALSGSVSINDSNQIAFNALLSNGTSAILIAQPSGAPHCPADVDDGTGTGAHDGGIDINDLLFFLAMFEAGDVAADLDDGSGTGNPDGAVTIEDLLFFLGHYEAGC